jgi:two-component system, OmpR family, sensor kinase
MAPSAPTAAMATSLTRRSVVRRLTIRAALWAAVLGLTLASVAVWQYWRVSRHALDARLLDDAQALAHAITVTDGALDVDLPAELRAALTGAQSYYGIYDAEGRLLDGDAPAIADAEAMRTALRSVAGYREARVSGPPGATVRVGRSLAPLHADVWRLATSILLASVVAILLAAPLTIWLRRELGRSMAQFDQTARALSPGQPARIDLARVDEEFAGVAARLNEAFDRLEQGLVREQQLTADASHELRTPVATIVTETEWALAQPRTEGEYRDALEVCARQGRRLKELVETLLALARLEAGAVGPAYEGLDVGALVSRAIADVQPLARRHEVTVESFGGAELRADRVQVGILLSNLLSNAVRYNRPGGHVRVTAGTDGDTVTLEVTDTGPGLDEGAADRVFDRFWRASPSRAAQEGGTGLGLAISKAIVDAHHGAIACHTGAEGTTFVVTLPRRGHDEPNAPRTSATHVRAPVRSRAGSATPADTPSG